MSATDLQPSKRLGSAGRTFRLFAGGWDLLHLGLTPAAMAPLLQKGWAVAGYSERPEEVMVI